MSQLLQAIEAFLEDYNIAPSSFGHMALGDKHFVRQLRNGRRVWDDTASKVRSFMDHYIATADVASSGNATKNTACNQFLGQTGSAPAPTEATPPGAEKAGEGRELPSPADMAGGGVQGEAA